MFEINTNSLYFSLKKQGLIKAILNKQASLFIKKTPTIVNYQGLKATIIQDEWQTEVKALYKILYFSMENFELAFKNRCAQRAKSNEGTCLSFSAMPNGTCNTMYWQIAEVLFHPTTLKEMLAVLVPHVTKQVIWQRVRKQGTNDPSLRGNFSVQLVELDEVALSEKPSLAVTQHLVMVDEFVIDTRRLTYLYFHEHVAYHHALSTQYAALSSALYEHNREFCELRSHILADRNLLETLICFVNDLKLSGTGITGAMYAATFAERAFENFISYLNALPEKERVTLLSLKNTHHTYTLHHAITLLEKGGCVESAGKIIQMIVNNQDNQRFLSRQLATTVEYQRSMLKRYNNKHHPLLTISASQNTILPEKGIESAFQQTIIQNVHDFLGFLISFSPSLYTNLLQHGQIKFDFLSETFHATLQEGILNDIQKKYFFDAVLSNTQRFGLEKVIRFIEYCKKEDILSYLNDLSREQFLSFMKQRNSLGQTILHYYVPILEAFRTILLLLPDDKTRLAALQECDYNGNSVLHAAMGHLETLQISLQSLGNPTRLDAVKAILYETNLESLGIILELLPIEWLTDLPKEQFLILMRHRNNHGQTVLHHFVPTLETFRSILLLFPDDTTRLAALQECDYQGSSVLHAAMDYLEALQISLQSLGNTARLDAVKAVLYEADPESLRIILESLPMEMRFEVLQFKKYGALTFINRCSENARYLQILLTVFPDDAARLVVSNVKDNQKNTVLHKAVCNVESLQIILSLFDKIARLAVIEMVDCQGNTVLHKAALYPLSLRVIFDSVPLSIRLGVIKKKNALGDTVLHKAIHFPDSLRVIFASLPDAESCFSLILMRNLEGNTALHDATRTPESLGILLEWLPIYKIRFLVSQLKNDEGKTVLDCASSYPMSLAIIQERLSSHHRIDAVALPTVHTAVNASSFFNQAGKLTPYEAILDTHFTHPARMPN